jgi:TolA-binding protein
VWWVMLERERLIARIRQLGRASAQRERPPARPAVDPDRDQLRSLEQRVEHLEALVQGVQDSMHRESLRQSARLSELEAQIQPAALGKALSDDARARGL